MTREAHLETQQPNTQFQHLPNHLSFSKIAKFNVADIAVVQLRIEAQNAYARNGLVDEASEIVQSVPASDSIAANAVLAAFARAGNVAAAKELFDSMPARTSGSWNSLAQGRASCRVRQGRQLDATRGTWVDMIRAYGEHGMVAEARTAFDNLPRVTVDACNTLIVAYARNGHLVEAKELFDAMLVRSTVTWASIMEACTMSNLAGQALEIFHLENCSGQLMLDRVVFSAVLSAHSWLGCLDDAAGIIRDMASDYAIRPSVEHYCAILAMLTSRSELGDAEDLAASMPFVASASACCSSTCVRSVGTAPGQGEWRRR
ncbi:pentatricopeptide repeat-containing protein At4g02750-like [Selaginella moellendorffii]|uniref:pentatricopeptide repeat-containing protein At4g02750-like n=1 Tax=Selaginella moellendorffii TaxID=88036 RepID=UPI000D1C41FF|nr:pentatricopeptide repeat-containing protein At4g02750-like [Selaginella moellendorffii]|eukprot:XP_024531910.1 pentatricopeptide repeat-containing protein At4g02750-like [Selaginella moellendorffii]